ncbi:MAG: alanine racemase [Gammaproteobacteria bacterium]
MRLDDLATPCLLIDKARFDANLARMRTRVTSLGATLRLHVKTTKSVEAARAASAPGAAAPIMVSTLAEARHFFENGFRDLIYGVGVAPRKLESAADLIEAGAELKLLLDSEVVAHAVAECGRRRGLTLPAFIEIDTDGHRSGIAPTDPRLLAIGVILQREKGAALAGVLTHAGESYNCTSVEGIRAMAAQEHRGIVAAATALRAAGLACPVVSLGSTPTALFAERLDGVTEVRAGVYVFQDLVMAGLGVCETRDIALSVLATVIGHQQARNWLICDAGWMALSRDRGTQKQRIDQGYGLVLDGNGDLVEDLIVSSANQEHGIVTTRDGSAVNFDRWPIGTTLRILPNHACATAAQHAHYAVVEGSSVIAQWPRIAGW